jgi:hypothetical protein
MQICKNKAGIRAQSWNYVIPDVIPILID